jgi:site-specific DNA recombinase
MMPTSAAKTAVLYARVSSKDQEREGYSIPAQQKLLREYAAVHGVTILRKFVDVETAKHTGRTGFGDMLVFLAGEPTCRTILVEKTDRLYRNIKDWITVDDLDIEVHFVKEGAVVSKQSRSSDKFMHGIKVLMAKQYVDNLSEEVKKGLREKAEQGHFPGVAHVGYINNRVTRRIEVDPLRGPLVAQVFDLYASGRFSLKTLRQKAFEIGLRHSRGDRRMTKSEIHRMLRNPIYTGDFLWLGIRRKGSHQALVNHDTFDRVQEVLGGTSRKRYARRQHAFMGLLTCARCGCTMTAEKKKGKYVYYRCTGFKGACGNTYMREERLADLLGDVITPIQISEDVAEQMAQALRSTEQDAERRRGEAVCQADQRRRVVVSKLDRGYEDFLEGKISETFWTRKSQEWEDELQTVDRERTRLQQPNPVATVNALKILELAKQAEKLYKAQIPAEQRRMLDVVLSNCTFDRGTLCPTYAKPFDLIVKGNKSQNWRGEWDSNHDQSGWKRHRTQRLLPNLTHFTTSCDLLPQRYPDAFELSWQFQLRPQYQPVQAFVEWAPRGSNPGRRD